MTDNPEDFKKIVKANTNCNIVVDESGEMIGRYAKDMGFLATRSRHYGHIATFISQRAQSIDRNVRDQCTRFFIFSQSKADGKLLAEALVEDEFLKCHELVAGECFAKIRFKPAVKLNVFT
jgi:hypothetical protein